MEKWAGLFEEVNKLNQTFEMDLVRPNRGMEGLYQTNHHMSHTPQYHSVHVLFPPDRPHWKLAYIYLRWMYFNRVLHGCHANSLTSGIRKTTDRLKLLQLEHLMNNEYVKIDDYGAGDMNLEVIEVPHEVNDHREYALKKEDICEDVAAALHVFDEHTKSHKGYQNLLGELAKVQRVGEFEQDAEEESILPAPEVSQSPEPEPIEEKAQSPAPPLEPQTPSQSVSSQRPFVSTRSRTRSRSPGGFEFVSPPKGTEDDDIPPPQYPLKSEDADEVEVIDLVDRGKAEVVGHLVVTDKHGKKTRTVVRAVPDPKEKEAASAEDRSATYYLVMAGLFIGLAWMLVDD